MVTDGNKIQFDIYLYDNFDKFIIVDEINNYLYSESEKTAYDIFELLPFEMQIGVYESYYFNVHKYLMTKEQTESGTVYCKTRGNDLLLLTEDFKSPLDAQKQWVEDMNSIINNTNNNT